MTLRIAFSPFLFIPKIENDSPLASPSLISKGPCLAINGRSSLRAWPTVPPYVKSLSLQLIEDVETLSGTINDLQDQIDSLAEVVLQNRRGLDLLTAEQGGICLALQERCCFYANKSGIVRDKVKKLQEDLIERRKQLFENPFLTSFHGLLPYLLPVLSPLIGLLLLISFGPWAFKRLTGFIKQQIDSLLAKPIHVHYHRLALADLEIDSEKY